MSLPSSFPQHGTPMMGVIWWGKVFFSHPNQSNIVTLIKAFQQFKRRAFLHIFSIWPNHRQAAHTAFHTGPHYHYRYLYYRFHLHYHCHHHHHYRRCVDYWYYWILIRPVIRIMRMIIMRHLCPLFFCRQWLEEFLFAKNNIKCYIFYMNCTSVTILCKWLIIVEYLIYSWVFNLQLSFNLIIFFDWKINTVYIFYILTNCHKGGSLAVHIWPE